MSALAKVFVVFIFVLSIAFFGTAATLYKTRTDWKTAYETLDRGYKQELGTLRDKVKELYGKLNDNEMERNRIKAVQDELAAAHRKLTEDYKNEKNATSLAQASADKSNSVNLGLTKDLDAEKQIHQQLNDSLTKVKSDHDTALQKTAAATQARDSMKLDLDKALTDLHALRTEHQRLTEDFESIDTLLTAAMEKYPDIKRGPQPPRPIDGVVKAVSPKEKLVVLSVGKDQKVEMGYEFTIHRDGEFIGKVKVFRVFPDVCGAEVLFTKEGSEIQENDKATTKI